MRHNDFSQKNKSKGEPILIEAIIALIDRYVSGLLKAKEDFLERLDKLDVLERTVCDLSNNAVITACCYWYILIE